MSDTSVPGAGMLSAAMDGAGMSNKALADLLDVRPSMVSMMRTGRMDIPVCRVVEISMALRIDPSALAEACVASYPGSRSWQAYALGCAAAGSRPARAT